MSPYSLWASLADVTGILLAATIAGRLLARAFVPTGPAWRLERWGWSIALAVLLLPLNVCVCLALGFRPGWISFLVLAGAGGAVAGRFALPRSDPPIADRTRMSVVAWLLLLLTAAGVLVYLAGSLDEPLASNDFFAIWGLKGKSIFGDGAIPRRLFDWPDYAFSNPAYPIGLPLLYAGIAFLLGRWDDHAMALVFPVFQVATLLVLVGWLKRRGASASVALAASAVVANVGLLYSPLVTGGMAEVPASFAFLLLGVAFCDALDRAGPGSHGRLAIASLLAAGVKNEGVFLLATAGALLVLRAAWKREPFRFATAAAVAIPGLGSFVLHRVVLGRHALRAFDFSLIRRTEILGLIRDALREAWGQLVVPAWPAVLALVFLIVFGRRNTASNALLALAGASLAVYLVLPAFCTFGPAWLVHWTVGRITVALAPLAAAGIAAGWGFPRGSASGSGLSMRALDTVP